MKTSTKIFYPVLMLTILLLSPSPRAIWTENGTPISTSIGDKNYSQIISDTDGGAIICWHDYRTGSGERDIFVQRVDGTGTPLWTAGGVGLCKAVGNQFNPQIVPDGVGGAIIVWIDYRSGPCDIYAQRITSGGSAVWAADGIAIDAGAGNQSGSRIISDGSGGAIITWVDFDGTDAPDIRAQRIDGGGNFLWTAGGVDVCKTTGDQTLAAITSDGSDGAIICWQDDRLGSNAIYAQYINGSGIEQWKSTGVVVCTGPDDQEDPRIVEDGSGGAIIVWADHRPGFPDFDTDIYAQRLSSAGARLWADTSIAIVAAVYDQEDVELISDGAGGAIAVWEDYRGNGTQASIYAQRFDGSGTHLWEAGETSICVSIVDQQDPVIVSNGSGGAIITWESHVPGEYDIIAQQVDPSGTHIWEENGLVICSAPDEQEQPYAIPDGIGGGIFSWSDRRTGIYSGIYAQRVDSDGVAGYISHSIFSVLDRPGDEGGAVTITIVRSSFDDILAVTYPVSTYNIWRRVDGPAPASEPFSAATGRVIMRSSEIISESPVDLRAFLESAEFPPGSWEIIGSFSACQQEEYQYLGVTTSDSTGAGIPWNIYCVSAHTTTPSVWFMCDPDSGYSVDNLPPGPPEALMAEQSFDPAGLSIGWMMNPEDDFSYYAVYRGTSESFVPAAGNLVEATNNPEYFDDEWHWDSGYYYKLSSVDRHGNESSFSLLSLTQITGDEMVEEAPVAYLNQNFPNPFNPNTMISFGIDKESVVSLVVFDASGRLVRVLINESRSIGHYAEIWDGKDSKGRMVSSGVYFYRLDAGSSIETRKMILLR